MRIHPVGRTWIGRVWWRQANSQRCDQNYEEFMERRMVDADVGKFMHRRVTIKCIPPLALA